MSRKNTKLLILEKGAAIVHKKGFNHTGIKEILDAAGVPKGSFYHYFKNKEDFGLNLLDYFAGFFIKKVDELKTHSDKPPVTRLKLLFDDFLCFFENNNCEMGCPIGNISQEMGDLSPAFSKKCEEIFLMMRAPIEKILDEAVQSGDVPESLNTHEAADFIINSWEGAILRMKVQKSTGPLYIFDKMVFEGMLGRKASNL